MDDIPIFYMLEKATSLTDYLTDVHYHGVHYIRFLMWSRVTTKYKICGILKIEKVIDVAEMQLGEGGCSGRYQADEDRVQAMEQDNILRISFLFLKLFLMVFHLLLIQDTNVTLFILKLSDLFYISSSV